MTHVTETDLALYLGGDLGFWARRSVRAHLAQCAQCRESHERFLSAREALRSPAVLPAGFDWDRVAAEMTANIHLGLAAGECVASKNEQVRYGYLGGWQRPAVVFAGTVLAVFLAWFAYTQKPADMMAGNVEPEGVMVESTASGIELNDNGRVFGLRHAADTQVIGVSLQGAVQSRYVDSETGQVTINNVYVQ